MKTPHFTNSMVPIPDPTKLTTDAVSYLKAELIDIIDLRFEALNDLLAEKFKRVDLEFILRASSRDAAFKAAESAIKQQNESNNLAIDKAGAAFTKQIDGLGEKINDLKDRMAQLSQGNWAAIGGYIIGVIGAIAIVLTILKSAPLHI